MATGRQPRVYENNRRLPHNSKMAAIYSWPLIKYSHWSRSTESWAEQQAMCLQINKSRYLQIVNEDTLLECVALSDANLHGWKAVRRGPNMLFKVQNDETNRKFRIRFLNSGELNADQVCSSCARQLSTFFEVRDADQEQQDLAAGRLPQRPPTPETCITLQQITTSLMESQRNKGTNDCRQVTSDLIDLVRSCVMDPAFPALVEQVECALKKLTTDEPSIEQI